MKRLLSLGILSVAGAVGAAPVPIFIIDTPTVLPDAGFPTINAQAFVNQSSFTVSGFSFFFGGAFFSFTSGNLSRAADAFA